MKKWITPLLSAFAAAIISLVVYNELPSKMVMHFNQMASPDNLIAKPLGAFLMPALALLIPASVFLASKLERDENKRRRAEAVNAPVAAMLSIMLLAVHTFLILYNLGYEIRVGLFVTVLVGILFILMGNLVPRIPQGIFQWPKLPEDIHRKASRFQGRLMMASGVIFLFAALLPNAWIMPAFILFISAFVITMFSGMMYFARTR
ncbi:DUF1648 domain-containing protein [Paenibacillus oenotherae]|uniref:DUF1648 domain-containing protein n=1 Tax=Paenibacillus oenotherae TaxID=1435645 RepID=A0ABS7D6K5_9BACL|nr:DUF1648 domain-containing protein [Paenibacillus oenotherae]MBW7475567.1 DUF1648 domain-containing protein [Paenibacillus oenotherae]